MVPKGGRESPPYGLRSVFRFLRVIPSGAREPRFSAKPRYRRSRLAVNKKPRARCEHAKLFRTKSNLLLGISLAIPSHLDSVCATACRCEKPRKSLHVFHSSTAKTPHRGVFSAQNDTRTDMHRGCGRAMLTPTLLERCRIVECRDHHWWSASATRKKTTHKQ